MTSVASLFEEWKSNSFSSETGKGSEEYAKQPELKLQY